MNCWYARTSKQKSNNCWQQERPSRRVTRFDFSLKLLGLNLSHHIFFTHGTHSCNQWSKWRHHQMEGTWTQDSKQTELAQFYQSPKKKITNQIKQPTSWVVLNGCVLEDTFPYGRGHRYLISCQVRVSIIICIKFLLYVILIF
jgi:hypothetical protein